MSHNSSGVVSPVQTMDVADGSVAFDIDAFDEALHAHGVQFIHYRALRSPVGLLDRYDSRRPNEDHSGSSNGHVYTKAGCMTAIFTNNSKDLRAIEGASMDSAVAQITPARFYDNSCEPILVAPFDRFFLAETSIEVTHSQLVDAHISGHDRLRFPCERVLDLIDSANIRYTVNDFDIIDGQIVWNSPKRPGIDPETGKGRVYAVRYTYRPHWYCDRLIKEIRMAQYQDIMTGERKTMRMPQSFMAVREYIFENENKDEQAPNPNSPRQVPSPDDNSFGSR